MNPYKNKTGVKIRLSSSSLHSKRNDNLQLTTQQINRIKTAIQGTTNKAIRNS